MAGPSGFVQRWQGKILGKLIGVGASGLTAYNATGGPVNLSGDDLASMKGLGTLNGTASTVSGTVLGSGITKLSTTTKTDYALGAPVARRRAIIYTDAVGDGARKVSSTAAGATIASTLSGAAFLNFSTVALSAVELIGVSTSLWIVAGNVGGAVTVSTS